MVRAMSLRDGSCLVGTGSRWTAPRWDTVIGLVHECYEFPLFDLGRHKIQATRLSWKLDTKPWVDGGLYDFPLFSFEGSLIFSQDRGILAL